MSSMEIISSTSSKLKSNGTASTSQQENGFVDSLSILHSEKAVKELIQEPLVQGTDDDLIEFSVAMHTVAKALRQVAEARASAQAEAAEWKRKYELERARNLHLENKVLSCGEQNGTGEKADNTEDQPVLLNQASEQSEKCCGKNGICSHEVLRDGEPDCNSNVVQNKFMRKASFKLLWCCKGEISDQHKRDVVSFERGNITTAERSSKQISLKWESPPQTLLILTKPNSISVRILCAEMVRWLKEQKKLYIFVEPRVRVELLKESSYFNFVQTWQDNDEARLLHTKVDLLVTLGGDGTVLWVTIDRGISSFLTNLECYCDNSFVTCVQGDGLILSTTSGSTAYSLAAGGSMVHPQVPGILFTPICPHSLSFRPLILPEHVTIQVQVPSNTRGHAWASFDGKDRKQLAPGDTLVCSVATWPVPAACQVDSTSDFLRSIHEDLHWNLRKIQSFDGPRAS